MIHATESLIEAACTGDKQALSKLLVVSQPDIKRFARRACATSEDVEDAVQIALWQLHKKIGTLKTIATFASWLFRIVERECYRLFKHSSHTEELSESVSDSLVAPIIDTYLRIDLARSITMLPPMYRTVLILRDIEELTAPEVAEKLSISLEAVKSRLHRARMMVRDDLIQGGYGQNNRQSIAKIDSGD